MDGTGMAEDFRDDRHCFVCGELNELGLKLSPTGEDSRGTIRWTPGREHQGYAGVVHGGLISTLMDEAMAYAAMSLYGSCATREMTVKFRRPVNTGEEVLVEAEITETRGKLVRLKASLEQDGQLKAMAEGTFVIQGQT